MKLMPVVSGANTSRLSKQEELRHPSIINLLLTKKKEEKENPYEAVGEAVLGISGIFGVMKHPTSELN